MRTNKTISAILFIAVVLSVTACGGRSTAREESIYKIDTLSYEDVELILSRTNSTSITIPGSVKSIEEWAFYSSRDLIKITVSKKNANYSSLDGVLFNKDKTVLIKYPQAKTGSYTIPNSVTSIENGAFGGCTSIIISNSITDIGERAFFDCEALTEFIVSEQNAHYSSLDGVLFNKDKTVLIKYPQAKTGNYTIPNSVTSIGNSAFWYCTGLTNITIPNSVTSIGERAFEICTSLASITLPNSLISIKNRTFARCTSITNIIIPNSVASIGEGAFEGCTSLASITLPNSLTSITNRIFAHCTSLTNIIIPNSVTDIGEFAFWGCRNLESVTIGNSVKSIGYNAFSGCTNLRNIRIPNSVTYIDKWNFFDCEALTEFIVSKQNANYSSLNGVLFNKDKTILIQYPIAKSGSYTVPNSVKMIENYAFYGCTSLESIVIPNSVKSIGVRAFENCTNLTRITLGDSVEYIGHWAFEGCIGLRGSYSKQHGECLCNKPEDLSASDWKDAYQQWREREIENCNFAPRCFDKHWDYILKKNDTILEATRYALPELPEYSIDNYDCDPIAVCMADINFDGKQDVLLRIYPQDCIGGLGQLSVHPPVHVMFLSKGDKYIHDNFYPDKVVNTITDYGKRIGKGSYYSYYWVDIKKIYVDNDMIVFLGYSFAYSGGDAVCCPSFEFDFKICIDSNTQKGDVYIDGIYNYINNEGETEPVLFDTQFKIN